MATCSLTPDASSTGDGLEEGDTARWRLPKYHYVFTWLEHESGMLPLHWLDCIPKPPEHVALHSR